jgi:hypothetical protein
MLHAKNGGGGGGDFTAGGYRVPRRVWSDYRFALPSIHVIPESRRDSVPLCLKHHCDRTLQVPAAAKLLLVEGNYLLLGRLPEGAYAEHDGRPLDPAWREQTRAKTL